MIKKFENGTTVIVLGEGTVFSGNIHVENSKLASGICFTNNQQTTGNPNEDSIIIQITNEKAVASYIMALLRVLETWEDDKESKFQKIVNDFKKDLEPLLDFSK